MNVHITKTKEYYNALKDSMLCDCDYCRGYRMQVKSAYPKVTGYLDSFGIDIEKPFETSPLEPDDNGMMVYCCCQYVVFGNCDSKYNHKIDNVEFRVATSYPNTGIEQEHFILEFYPIELKFYKGA